MPVAIVESRASGISLYKLYKNLTEIVFGLLTTKSFREDWGDALFFAKIMRGWKYFITKASKLKSEI